MKLARIRVSLGFTWFFSVAFGNNIFLGMPIEKKLAQITVLLLGFTWFY